MNLQQIHVALEYETPVVNGIDVIVSTLNIAVNSKWPNSNDIHHYLISVDVTMKITQEDNTLKYEGNAWTSQGSRDERRKDVVDWGLQIANVISFLFGFSSNTFSSTSRMLLSPGLVIASYLRTYHYGEITTCKHVDNGVRLYWHHGWEYVLGSIELQVLTRPNRPWNNNDIVIIANGTVTTFSRKAAFPYESIIPKPIHHITFSRTIRSPPCE